MALHHFPRIVTDGLVLCLDAANPLSYPSLGPELVTNSDLLVADDGNYDTIENTNSPICYTGAVSTAGKTYQVSWKVLARRGTTSATLRMNLTGIPNSINFNTTPGILNTSTVTIPNSSSLNIVADNTGVDFDLDYVSIREMSTIINDISGNDNNGTLFGGPTYSSANRGGLVFDGVDNYISIPYTSQLAPTSAISFGAWTYLSDWNINFGTNGRRIISKTESGGYQMGAGGGTMGTDNVGALLYINSSYRVVKIAKNLISSGWHYLLFTFDGQYFKMYLDGTLVDTYNHGSVSSIIYNYNNIVAIGAEPNGSTGVTGNYWNGNIALISIYNKALSANQVSQNFNATKGRYGL